MLLTIAVPTFNRCAYLERLLEALGDELAGLEADVEFIVSDNASIDSTPDVLERCAKRLPGARIIRNASNIGAEANVRQCYKYARGDYVWIVGDDDMPKRGTVAVLVERLANDAPDIVYLPSEWVPSAISPDQGRSFDPDRRELVDALTFARRTNVFLTFLSGMVVRSAHAACTPPLQPIEGSNLPQLDWIFAALSRGRSFLIFDDAAVLATGGNSGGYAIVATFGVTLPDLVAGQFGRRSPMYRAIIGPATTRYLPQLILSVRTGVEGRFTGELPWVALRQRLGRFASFWMFVIPAGRAPLPVSRVVLLVARLTDKIRRVLMQSSGRRGRP